MIRDADFNSVAVLFLPTSGESAVHGKGDIGWSVEDKTSKGLVPCVETTQSCVSSRAFQNQEVLRSEDCGWVSLHGR